MKQKPKSSLPEKETKKLKFDMHETYGAFEVNFVLTCTIEDIKDIAQNLFDKYCEINIIKSVNNKLLVSFFHEKRPTYSSFVNKLNLVDIDVAPIAKKEVNKIAKAHILFERKENPFYLKFPVFQIQLNSDISDLELIKYAETVWKKSDTFQIIKVGQKSIFIQLFEKQTKEIFKSKILVFTKNIQILPLNEMTLNENQCI